MWTLVEMGGVTWVVEDIYYGSDNTGIIDKIYLNKEIENIKVRKTF